MWFSDGPAWFTDRLREKGHRTGWGGIAVGVEWYVWRGSLNSSILFYSCECLKFSVTND